MRRHTLLASVFFAWSQRLTAQSHWAVNRQQYVRARAYAGVAGWCSEAAFWLEGVR